MRYKLSAVTRGLGDIDATRTYLQKACDMAPDHAPYLAKRVLLDFSAVSKAGDPDRQTRGCAELTADAERLVTLEASADYLKLAGRIAGCAGKSSEAVDLFSRAVSAGAEDWETSYQLGRQQTRTGDTASATKTLSSLLAKSTPAQTPKVHEELGYAFQLQSRFDQAIDHYAKAGADNRLSQAKEAQKIHLANLAEQERHQEELALRKKIEDLEKQAQQAANGEL